MTTSGPALHRLGKAFGPFGSLDTGRRTNLFELKPLYGVSDLRDVTVEEGSGAVSHIGPALKLATTASGADRAVLETAQIGRYVPGLVAEPGIYFKPDGVTLTGDMVRRWGYFNAQNGLFFGEDSDGLFIEVRSGGSSVEKIRQADWNMDTLDGSGDRANPSGLNLDVSDGHVYRMPFIWYGSGPAIFEVMVQRESTQTGGTGFGRSELVQVHEFARTDGNRLIENPNLPISAELDNAGVATAMTAEVSGRQFSVRGEYHPVRRAAAETVEGVTVGTSGFTPLMSFRRKANVTDGAFFEATSVKIEDVEILSNNDLVILILQDPDLTSPTWGDPTNFSAAETSVQVDTAATVAGGHGLWETLAAGGQGSRSIFSGRKPFDFDFIRRRPVTVLARAIDTSATVDCTTRVREEW